MTAANPHYILFDCDRLRHLNTGLFHYCMQLGNALLNNFDPAQEHITIYVRKNRAKYLKSNDFIFQKGLDKFIFPNVNKYSIWHCNYQNSLYHARDKRLRKVFTIHDLNFLHGPGSENEKINVRVQKLKRIINKYDHLVFISEFVKNDALKYVEIGNKPYSVIYNGCNFLKTDMLLESSIKVKAPFLFTIGEIHHKKNFHVLTRLLPDNNFYLVIAGFPHEDYVAKILKEAERLKVANRVIITG
ncbi:MAG: glycosyltransferase, partial [Flavisolibacter sp.]